MKGVLLVVSIILATSSCSIRDSYDVIIAPEEVRQKAIEYARKYIEAGAGYQWGGQDPLPKIVVDCSGLVIRCYEYATRDYGYFLLFKDETSYGLKRYTKELSLSELGPGDLLFMGEDNRISHVALFVKTEADRIVFIDSTLKSEEGINGVSERSYSMNDPRFISFGRLYIGKP